MKRIYGSNHEEIYVPENIVGMEEGAFLGLPDLEWLEVEACNPNFSSLDGVIFDKEDFQAICISGCENRNV